MNLKMYQVDAFTDRTFGGNPAAVVPLDSWLPDETLQAIGLENNLSETAFFISRDDGDFDLRWFTPAQEVDLCGHATLASAHILWEMDLVEPDKVARFRTRSGLLMAERRGDLIELNLLAEKYLSAYQYCLLEQFYKNMKHPGYLNLYLQSLYPLKEA